MKEHETALLGRKLREMFDATAPERLPAGDREPRRVLGKPDSAAKAPRASLAHVARHARDLGIIEGADAHAVVLADEPEGRADARQVVGARRDSPAEEASHAEQGEQSGSEHMLAHAASARAGISTLPRRLAPEAVVAAVAASATGSSPRASCARTNAATWAISWRKREPLKMP